MTSSFTVGDRAILVRKGYLKESFLFLVHDEYGSLDYASILSPYLNQEMNLYGLPSGSSALDRGSTLQEMASRFVAMIRSIQPKGPYYLAGYSLGSILAYEVAVQMLGEDESIEFLGLLNSLSTPFTRRKSEVNIKDQLLLRLGSSIPALTPEQTISFSHDFSHAVAQYYPQPVQIPVFAFPFTNSVETRGTDCGWARVISQQWLRIVPVEGSESSIMKAPNVCSFSRLISNGIREARVMSRRKSEHTNISLIPLQTGRDDGPYLFCVPGAGATVVTFTDLIAHLGRGWRVYGLQPRGMDGRSIPHTSIAAAAESYIKAIQRCHSKGPLHLLGHSYGGWAVYEMACRLIAAGRGVASVTIIDSTVPNDDLPSVRAHAHSEVLQRWIDLFEMLLEQPLGVSITDLDGLSLPEQLIRIHKQLLHCGLMPKSSNPNTLHGPFHTFAAALRSQFTPKYTLHGSIHLVIADNSHIDAQYNQHSSEQTISGWRHWAPELQVFHAGGNHMSMLREPYVDAVGDWLRNKFNSRCMVFAKPSK